MGLKGKTSSASESVLISIDSGAGYTKYCVGGAGYSYPSVYGTFEDRVDFEINERHDLVFGYDNRMLVAGDSVFTHGASPVMAQHETRIDTDFYDIMIASVLASVCNESCSVRLVLNIPLRYYQEREQIKSMLRKTFRLGVYDSSRRYKIIDVEVKRVLAIPEGMGALNCAMFDENGNEQMYNSNDGRIVPFDGDRNIGIIDIGTLTTDLLFFEHMVVNQSRSTSEPRGLRDIFNAIRGQAQANGVLLESYQLDGVFRSGYYTQRGGRVSVSSSIHEASEHLAGLIEGLVRSNWNGGDAAEDILVLGGGSKPVFPLLQRRMAHSGLRIFDLPGVEPYIANAVGGYRWGLAKMAKEATENAQT